MGRSEDLRAPLELSDAKPRECLMAANAALNKVSRLAQEVGAVPVSFSQVVQLRDARPGHVLNAIKAVQQQVDAIRQHLKLGETAAVPEIEASRQPADVLVTLIQINRQISRALERPFTPADVYETVAIASSYATRLGSAASPAAFERKRTPRHCYERLMACHAQLGKRIAKHGDTTVAMRVVPAEVVPGDVYDMAMLVLGEVALLSELSGHPPVLAAFGGSKGQWLPGHVDQLARTLEAQLAAVA